MKKLVLLLLICASTQLQGMDSENWRMGSENWPKQLNKQLKRKMYQLACTKGFLSRVLTLANKIDHTPCYFEGFILGYNPGEPLLREMDFYINILNKAYGEFSSKNCRGNKEGSCYEDLLQFIGKSIRKE